MPFPRLGTAALAVSVMGLCSLSAGGRQVPEQTPTFRRGVVAIVFD